MFKYEKINRNNLCDVIAAQLEKMILDESLKVGDRIPPEQVLAEQFGVSRNILREALKTLKERGLLDIKTGKGAYVTKPESSSLSDTVNRLLVLSDVSLMDIYEIRSALEVKACSLAAERADDEDINKLDMLAGSMEKHLGNIDEWVNAELQFHTSIAMAAKNPLFHTFIGPLTNALKELFTKGYYRTHANQEGIRGHKAIVEAIKNHNSIEAGNAMYEHLERSRHLVVD